MEYDLMSILGRTENVERKNKNGKLKKKIDKRLDFQDKHYSLRFLQTLYEDFNTKKCGKKGGSFKLIVHYQHHIILKKIDRKIRMTETGYNR